MDLTNEMIQYCESQPWDDDLRQEVYVKVLETTNMKEVNNAWLSRIYTNLTHNTRRDDSRRKELLEEHSAEIATMLGFGGIVRDPQDAYIISEQINIKLKELSPLLRVTLERVVIEGVTPEEVAEEEGTSVNVIYQRVHEAKKLLRGNDND